jgi:uncharacterized protein YecE (DUF72 family)
VSARLLIGTQGWAFDGWVGSFYPHGTPRSGMLPLYARAFATVEVDVTAFGLPPEPLIREWMTQVGEGFVFSPRIPQQITHERQLVDTERVLRRFADRVAGLGPTLGPLIAPMSRAFRPTDANRSALRAFFEGVPEGFRWAVEFRHPGWLAPATLDLLHERGIALVLADARWIRREMMIDLALEPTTDFAVIRWSGAEGGLTDISCPQRDRSEELAFWRDLVMKVAERVSVVTGYFDNQFEGHAPHSARALQRLLDIEPVPPSALRDQGELL